MKQLVAGLALVVTVACMPAAESPATDSEVVDGTSSQSETDRSFSLEEARDIHRRFDPTFSEWTRGEELPRYVYLHMSEFWPQIVLRRNGPIRSLALNRGADIERATVSVAAGETTLADYVGNSAVDGALVVHDGRIVFEAYPRMLPSDRHAWFSISKTMVSTSIAILKDRGRIDVSRPIDSYLVPLAGTAWEGTPVIDLLGMASGIDCPEVLSERVGGIRHIFGQWPEYLTSNPFARSSAGGNKPSHSLQTHASRGGSPGFLVGRRRGDRRGSRGESQVLGNRPCRFRWMNRCENPHRSVTVRALQHVHLEDPAHQLGPVVVPGRTEPGRCTPATLTHLVPCETATSFASTRSPNRSTRWPARGPVATRCLTEAPYSEANNGCP